MRTWAGGIIQVTEIRPWEDIIKGEHYFWEAYCWGVFAKNAMQNLVAKKFVTQNPVATYNFDSMIFFVS